MQCCIFVNLMYQKDTVVHLSLLSVFPGCSAASLFTISIWVGQHRISEVPNVSRDAVPPLSDTDAVMHLWKERYNTAFLHTCHVFLLLHEIYDLNLVAQRYPQLRCKIVHKLYFVCHFQLLEPNLSSVHSGFIPFKPAGNGMDLTNVMSYLYRLNALVPQGKANVEKDHWWQWYTFLD